MIGKHRKLETMGPIGGSLGHLVAGLFSRDPKSEMDDDLLRLKTYIEKGKVPHDAAAKRRNDMKIEEIMTKNPMCCTDTTSLHEVAQMMVENDCGCIPVVENAENKKPIGMITDRDITIRTVAHNKNPLQMIAGEVMTDSVITGDARDERRKMLSNDGEKSDSARGGRR